jgi:protease-4
VSKVAEARKRPYNQVEPLAQGRVWLGAQAKERGLVDELGGIDRAIELVKERAKIGKDEKVALVTYPPKRSVLDILMSRTPEVAMESKLSPLAKLARNAHLKLLTSPGLLRLMPYAIEIR